MNDERVMIACCSHGTRLVIFKIERTDYRAVYISGINSDTCKTKIKAGLEQISDVTNVTFCGNYIEVYLQNDIDYETIKGNIEKSGQYSIFKIR